MIIYKYGDMFEDIGNVEAIVNTINCVGIMGKGIALEFKKLFPENFKSYKQACENKTVVPGKMFITYNTKDQNTKYLINFPTKKHWRNPSKMEYVEKGLDDLLQVINNEKIKSISIPALGCGNGQLNWDDVKPLIEKKLSSLNDVEIRVYEPSQQSQSKQVKTKKPVITKSRGLLLLLIEEYNLSSIDKKATYREINLLAFIIQSLGSEMNLKFKLEEIGPCNENINKLLKVLNHHYIYVEARENEISQVFVDKAKFKQRSKLLKDESLKPTLEKAKKMIKGFESPDLLLVLAVSLWFYNSGKNEEELLSCIETWLGENNHLISKPVIEKAVNRVLSLEDRSQNLSLF